MGITFYKTYALHSESTAFVDSAVLAISANWRKEELLQRASPELRDSDKPDELNLLFSTLSRFGPLIEYQGATGQVRTTYITGSGDVVTGSYAANARFQNGSTVLRIVVQKRDGRWMIQSFHSDSVPGSKAPQDT